MKGLYRLYRGLNAGMGLSTPKIPLINRRTGFYERHPQARWQSSRFSGPGLRDFIVSENLTKPGTISENVEPVPYLDELDLHGNGRKVYFEIQGCQMNENDIEVVWSILKQNGYEKTTLKRESDIVLFMTCSIRDSAEAKLWDSIKAMKSFKSKHGRQDIKVGILGCMAERLKNKILEIDKTVDLVAGPDSYRDLPRLLALTRNNQKAVNVLLSLDETYADIMPVRLDENQVTAFISVMRGCDNMCTYCIVPFTRGRERSRPIESILDEVRMLSDQGVKQITLLGQNVNSYRDTSVADDASPTKLATGFKTVYKSKKGGLRFDVLLDKVSQIDPNMRIRFTSPHPKDFPDEVLHLIRERKNICCNLHLPAQSGSSSVLERMRRGYTKEAYLDLVDHIRSIIPGVHISTDIISGFCGETEEDHLETLDLLRKVEYNFVFYFIYSMREKTTAHRRYSDDVPKAVKSRRAMEVQAVFRPICERLNKSQIGQTQLILIDGFSKKSEEYLNGRNDGNTNVLIPFCEIPCGINSTERRPIKPGDYVAVQVTDATSQVLRGTPLYHTSLVEFDESVGLKRLEATCS